VTATLATCQPAGAGFRSVFDSRNPNPEGGPAPVAADGTVTLQLAPLQCVVLKALAPLAAPGTSPSIHFAAPSAGSTLVFTQRYIVGQVITERQELRAEVTGGDGFAEVTFAMERASRPGQSELMGTEDAHPSRVFWRPPADLAPGEELAFIATVDDLRGHRVSDRIGGLRVAPSSLSFGIKGAKVPVFDSESAPMVTAKAGQYLKLTASASGTGPLGFQWLHNGEEIAGAFLPELVLNSVSAGDAGRYVALARNREGTAISRDIDVAVGP
jgi:hypothetical protein